MDQLDRQGSGPAREATRFTAGELERVAAVVLGGLGAPADLAASTARSLATANLMGHDSHGVIRLLQYADWVETGQIVPSARPDVRTRGAATACVDGHWGLGQPAAQLAAGIAADLAASFGVGAVSISQCNHIGRLGEYVEFLADSGCVGLALCNSGPIVAPAGGSRRTLGTNPLAWAAPRSGGPPIVLDFSTAASAEGKVKVALAAGASLADGVLIDRNGHSSRDPADLYEGGALLPFGGHKGSGLSLMIELVGGLLTGMGAAPMSDYLGGNGSLIIALNIAAFTTPERFGAQAAAFAQRVTEGTDGRRDPDVLLPGEVEQRTVQRRRGTGIEVVPRTRADITRLAEKLGLDLGAFAARPLE